jgi:hypothetical protein
VVISCRIGRSQKLATVSCLVTIKKKFMYNYSDEATAKVDAVIYRYWLTVILLKKRKVTMLECNAGKLSWRAKAHNCGDGVCRNSDAVC